MKAEQLEKIVKANFAVTGKWSLSSQLEMGNETILVMFVHFGQQYLTFKEMSDHLGVDVGEIARLVNMYEKHRKSGRFEIKRRLVERKIELEYEKV